jgi:hypothetical protein
VASRQSANARPETPAQGRAAKGERRREPATGNIVDGVVIRSGQPFNASGENYLITSFRPR